MKIFLRILAVLVVLYATLGGCVFAVMHQPLDRFGKIMARVPGPLFAVVPFKPLWLVAREGHLKVGDAAPNFTLETYDHKARVELSSLRGQKPVVLVFGSYT